jgi:hypothetical protein
MSSKRFKAIAVAAAGTLAVAPVAGAAAATPCGAWDHEEPGGWY